MGELEFINIAKALKAGSDLDVSNDSGGFQARMGKPDSGKFGTMDYVYATSITEWGETVLIALLKLDNTLKED